ncbi:MAG: GntR family transcriptional regulator [Mycobacteriales bacterium]
MTDPGFANTSAPYVTAQPAGQSDAWTAEAKALGRKGSQILREVVEVAPSSRVGDSLGLAAGDKVIARRRTILLDDHPVEIADSYYPLRIAQGTGLAEPRKIRGGAPTLLAELGFTATEVQEEITVRPADTAEPELLEIEPGTLVIELYRITLASDSTPFEASIMTMLPEGRTFRYHLKV